MSRALAVIAGFVLCARIAHADAVATNVRELGRSPHYRVRLAAALTLAKSHDPRAVIALSDALEHDDNATIRRVAALALGRSVDGHTPDDARQLAVDALDRAAAHDSDDAVRTSSKRSLVAITSVRAHPSGPRPPVFVNVEAGVDQTRRAPRDAAARLAHVVQQQVARTGYATSWPGGLPTSAELSSARSRAFIIASTVKRLDIRRVGDQTQVACTVAIRIAPWDGRDGGEKWEANRAASATGSAKATTGNSQREVSGGVRDCLEAVAEDVTDRQVVPFLRHLAQSGG